MPKESLVDYSQEVIWLGDNASDTLQESCQEANKNTWVAWFFKESSWYELKKWFAAKESIDGVGTKVQIYTEAFEWYYLQYKNSKIGDFEFMVLSVDIWERMLHDLIAMNTDDLRNGEMAVAVTNIIDVNHLKWWERGKVFVDSLALAMKNVIKELDIMITAGETAILWEPKKVWEIIEAIEEVLEWVRETPMLGFLVSPFIKMVRKWVKDKLAWILPKIEFNIAGTSLGITDGKEKLVPIQEWDDIILFEETPHQGIRWPRSNGLTAIRKMMTELAWRGWENLTFEEFMAIAEVARRGHMKINGNIENDCKWKKMWEIATWKTTVFNPFISRILLGWKNINSLDITNISGDKFVTIPHNNWSIPKVKISSIIHITGNPGKKILDGLQWHSASISNRQIPQPHIISLLCSLYGINTKDAMSSWNCNMPYALTCPPSETEKVLKLAKQNGFIAAIRGSVWEYKWKDAVVTMFDRLDGYYIDIKN